MIGLADGPSGEDLAWWRIGQSGAVAAISWLAPRMKLDLRPISAAHIALLPSTTKTTVARSHVCQSIALSLVVC